MASLSSQDRTQFSFSSLPGQGVIFSVIVRDPVLNTSASYIPVHTYACSFSSTLDGCSDLGQKIQIPKLLDFVHIVRAFATFKPCMKRSFVWLLSSFCDRFDVVFKCVISHFSGRVSTKVFFTVIGLAGLFVCFVGHRFFKCGERCFS